MACFGVRFGLLNPETPARFNLGSGMAYFFRGFIFLFPARFAAARPLVVYGYFFFPTLGISNSPHKWTSDKIVVYASDCIKPSEPVNSYI